MYRRWCEENRAWMPDQRLRPLPTTGRGFSYGSTEGGREVGRSGEWDDRRDPTGTF